MASKFTGLRAEPAEITAWVLRLRQWQPPPQFSSIVDEIRDRLGDRSIDQPGVPFREAHIATQCASALNAIAVRLGDDPPDFELRVGQRVVQCEAVEVLAPSRRRGDELNLDRQRPDDERAKIQHIPDDEWLPAPMALKAVSDRVLSKAQKGYPLSTVLVVYLNLGFSDDQRALDGGMQAATSVGFPAFSEIWILSNGEVVPFFP